MKITIRNWGPILKFEYDFSKSLIVTYGDNNIGKSYAMQIVYLFLKHLIQYAKDTVRRYRGAYYYMEDISEKRPSVGKIVLEFAKSQEEVEDVSQKLEEVYAKYLEQELLPQLTDSLRNTFGTYEEILKDGPLIVLEIEDEMRCRFRFDSETIDIRIRRKPTRLRRTLSDFHKSRNGKEQLDIYVYESYVNTPIQLLAEELWKMRKEFSIAVLKRVKDVYFLPASRSGIYTGMSSFGPILAQISQNRAYIRGPIQIPSIPEPISDYYMQLSEIEESTQIHFAECAEQIEREILKGEVIYNRKSRSIVYKPFQSELQLEMRDTSSMVSEISPITAFLKYIVSKGINIWIRRAIGQEIKPASVIFIEEPEAHLHPKNQIALIKAFAELSKQNVTLVMASHSNYIFNQLNNLVLDGKLSRGNYSPILLEKRRRKSVSGFMQIDELGVDDENFADISGQLLEEREHIIEKLMSETEDTNDRDDQEGNET